MFFLILIMMPLATTEIGTDGWIAGIEPMLAERQYADALNTLADLRDPVDKFFDDVMVMAEDESLRRNRLALLAQMRALFLQTADLSRLGG